MRMNRRVNIMVKIDKCPKCGAEIIDEENELCIQQKFSTMMNGTMNSEGVKEFDDKDAGYDATIDYIDTMLSEEGEPEIFGCKKCINDQK
jgi:Zn-finger nucleic acid-binding protein